MSSTVSIVAPRAHVSIQQVRFVNHTASVLASAAFLMSGALLSAEAEHIALSGVQFEGAGVFVQLAGDPYAPTLSLLGGLVDLFSRAGMQIANVSARRNVVEVTAIGGRMVSFVRRVIGGLLRIADASDVGVSVTNFLSADNVVHVRGVEQLQVQDALAGTMLALQNVVLASNLMLLRNSAAFRADSFHGTDGGLLLMTTTANSRFEARRLRVLESSLNFTSRRAGDGKGGGNVSEPLRSWTDEQVRGGIVRITGEAATVVMEDVSSADAG